MKKVISILLLVTAILLFSNFCYATEVASNTKELEEVGEAVTENSPAFNYAKSLLGDLPNIGFFLEMIVFLFGGVICIVKGFIRKITSDQARIMFFIILLITIFTILLNINGLAIVLSLTVNSTLIYVLSTLLILVPIILYIIAYVIFGNTFLAEYVYDIDERNFITK